MGGATIATQSRALYIIMDSDGPMFPRFAIYPNNVAGCDVLFYWIWARRAISMDLRDSRSRYSLARGFPLRRSEAWGDIMKKRRPTYPMRESDAPRNL